MVALAVAAVVLGASPMMASAGLLSVRQAIGQLWGGYNITQECLNVKSAISGPTCNVTQPCVQFVTQVIPQCLTLQGDPGCWCANPDPLHYCAVCMSNPTDNTTNPEQTQTATISHANYHKGCGAYQAFLNATVSGSLTSTSTAPATSSSAATATAAASNSGSSSLSSGALAGIVVGGIIVVIVIGIVGFLIYRHMQNKHVERTNAAGTGAGQYTSFYHPGSGMPREEPKLYANQPVVPGFVPSDTLSVHRPPQTGSPPPPFNAYETGAVPPTAVSTYSQPTSGARDSMYTSATSDYDTRILSPNSPGFPPAPGQVRR
ncbi:hypothetical protein FRB99_003508 [Tulasnella sp. 403]|nr:hypothetical protein FRB99_003508 [Tulasnella sp. 403]